MDQISATAADHSVRLNCKESALTSPTRVCALGIGLYCMRRVSELVLNTS